MSLTQAQLEEMWEWYQQRKMQQLVAPLDDVSRSVFGAALSAGIANVTLTQTIGAVPATVPAAYKGAVILNIDGSPYNIPHI